MTACSKTKNRKWMCGLYVYINALWSCTHIKIHLCATSTSAAGSLYFEERFIFVILDVQQQVINVKPASGLCGSKSQVLKQKFCENKRSKNSFWSFIALSPAPCIRQTKQTWTIEKLIAATNTNRSRTFPKIFPSASLTISLCWHIQHSKQQHQSHRQQDLSRCSTGSSYILYTVTWNIRFGPQTQRQKQLGSASDFKFFTNM